MTIFLLEPKLHPEAEAFLKTVKGRVAVVVLAGKCRSGKSFLINLLTGYKACEVGHTTKAMTKGLRILNKATPAKQANGDEFSVLWVDTEGIWDTEEDDNNDMKIFTFACLLGSHVILNINKNIGSENLGHLQIVT